MSSKFITSLVVFAIGATLPACSSVNDTIPVVKLERKGSKTVTTQHSSYISPSPAGSGPSVQKAEAATVCESENMRARARDDNKKNDSARVLILEDDADDSSQVVGEVIVNCRDYFVNKSVGLAPSSGSRTYTTPQPSYSTPSYSQTAQQQPVFSPAPKPTYAQPKYEKSTYEAPKYAAPQLQRASTARTTVTKRSSEQGTGLFYAVNRGDTLYSIARNHCTSVDSIAALNNIPDPTQISVGAALRMPVGNCN